MNHPRLIVAALAIAGAFVPAFAAAQLNTTTVILGRVMVKADAAVPSTSLPYASITLNGKNAQLTDSTGHFHIEGIAEGSVTIRARHIGFAPSEQVVHINRGDTVRVTLQLTRLAIQLPAVYAAGVCTNPGAPGKRSDPGLVALFEQLKENADHYRLLLDTHPYVYESERQFVTTLNDSVLSRTPLETLAGTSTRTWKYEPGKMTFEDATTSVTNMHLPGLGEFTDDAFVKNHCFDYGGMVNLDSLSLIEVDFTPDQKIKFPDVQGAIFLDPKTYQIRRAQLTLSKIPWALSGQITGHTVTTYFTEIVPGIPIIGSFRGEVMGLRDGEVRTEMQRVVEVQFVNGKPL